MFGERPDPAVPREVTDTAPIDVGILIPLEEEFSYFLELLTSSRFGVVVRAEHRWGRYYYLFDIGGVRCAATIVGEMGLVRMTLATEDIRRAFRPSAIVLLGIAAGFSGRDGDVKICDVVVARSVDLYLHRGRNQMGTSVPDASGEVNSQQRLLKMAYDQPIETSPALVDFITADARFAKEREQWRHECSVEMEGLLEPHLRDANFQSATLDVSRQPDLFGVCLASGELLAAAGEFVAELKDRGCSAADMEAGGAAVAHKWTSGMSGSQLLILRGISDRGDENKVKVQNALEPGIFRKACLRNASRLLFILLANRAFIHILKPRRLTSS